MKECIGKETYLLTKKEKEKILEMFGSILEFEQFHEIEEDKIYSDDKSYYIKGW